MRVSSWRRGIVIGVLLIVIVWLVTLIAGLIGKAYVAVREADTTKQQYKELEARKRALTESLNALKTPQGQDAAIRTAFGVARPGEEVIVVVPPATTTPAATSSWWQKILNWL